MTDPRTVQWYVWDETSESELGPYSYAELQQYSSEERIDAGTALRPENSETWYKAKKIPGLIQKTAEPVFEIEAELVELGSTVESPKIQQNAAPQKTRSSKGLLIGLGIFGGVMLLGLSTGLGYMVGRSAPPESNALSDIQEQKDQVSSQISDLEKKQADLEETQEELETQNRQLRGQAEEIRRAEEESRERKKQIEQEIQNLVSFRDELHSWQKADFALVEPGNRVISMETAENGFRVIHNSAEHQELVLNGESTTKFDAIIDSLLKARIPCVASDPQLVRTVARDARIGEAVPEILNKAIRKHWKPQQFVPSGPEDNMEFVSFVDIQKNRRRVGLFADATPETLTVFTLNGELEEIPRTDILPGSTIKGTEDRLLPALDERYFVDYCLFNIAQKMQGAEGEEGIRSLVLKVTVDDVERAERTRPQMGELYGTGGLGTVLVAGLKLTEYLGMVAERNQQDRRLRPLEDAVAYLEDEMYSRLSKLGVVILERENRDELLDQLGLADPQAVQIASIGRQLFATHALVVELKPPEGAGRYHLSFRLVDLLTDQVLWSSQADRVPEFRVKSRDYHLDSGKLAILQTRDESFKPLETPLKVKRPEVPSPRSDHLVYLEPSPAESSEILYRPLFDTTIRKIDKEKVTEITEVKTDADVPFHDYFRYLACEVARRTRDVGGRITSVNGNNVTISMGHFHGIRNKMRLRVLRDLSPDEAVARKAVGATQMVLPIYLRVTETHSNHSEAQIIRSGMEDYWPEDFKLQAGDVVVSEIHRRALLLVSPVAFNRTVDKNVYKGIKGNERIMFSRATAAANDFSISFNKAFGQSLAELDIPMTLDPRDKATHSLKGFFGVEDRYPRWKFLVGLQLNSLGGTGALNQVEKSFNYSLNDKQVP